MGQENSFNKAWEAAHSGKPLRDIAFRADITKEERAVIEVIADRLENKELEGEMENKKPKHELLETAFELVRHNPNLKFEVFAIGNVLAEQGEDTVGGAGYYFDQKEQKMNPIQDSSLDFLDDNPKNNVDKVFQSEWHKYQFKNGLVCIAVRMPILASYGYQHNPYITDTRGGCHISLALEFNEKKIGEIGNKEITDKLVSFDTGFLGKLFNLCAKEFIPDYWNYILKLREKFTEQHKS